MAVPDGSGLEGPASEVRNRLMACIVVGSRNMTSASDEYAELKTFDDCAWRQDCKLLGGGVLDIIATSTWHLDEQRVTSRISMTQQRIILASD